MKKSLLTVIILISYLSFYAQELNCRITVNSQQIQGTNKKVFETMQTAIYEFMNNRKWTDHVYSNDERIECTISLNITQQVSADEFKGDIQVQSRRPILNSTYSSTILNYKDKDLHFKYIEYQTLEFSETTNMSNLTSILAYYAYLIIGLDYDTFSIEGGTPYFTKVEAIVNNSQNAPEKGWKAYEDQKNRYWLIENIMDKTFSQYRQCMYQYHRLGFDRMFDKQTEGRTAIAESIELLQKVKKEKPSQSSFLLQIFFDAKADEVINIFSESFPDEKNRIIAILKEIDASNAAKYEKIRTASN